MGLAERRGVKIFQEQTFPGLKERMDAAAGFEVPVEVAWDTLAVEDYAHLYEEAFPKVYFEPVIGAIEGICIDDMGQEALREGLKQVVLRNSGSTELSFVDGVLLVDHHPVTNLDDTQQRTDQLQRALEKGL